MNAKSIYAVMLAMLLTHEIDAGFRHEWRVLPLTSFLPDHIGREIFIWAHVPLIAGILIGSGSERLRTGMAGFCIIHVGLHWLFRNNPAYEFNNASSWGLILATGLAGAAYLIAARGPQKGAP